MSEHDRVGMPGLLRDEIEREQHEVRDAYGLALGSLLLSTLAIIAAGVPVSSWLAVAALVFQAFALVVTLRVSGVERRSFWGGLAAIAVMVVIVIVLILSKDDMFVLIAVGIWLTMLFSAIVAIMARLRSYRVVNIQLVLGLLCVYLLVGLLFAYTYLFVHRTAPGSFTADEFGLSSAVYFSFITIATVGYGDISPLGQVARSLAVAEAMFGQFYLVSIVSLAVSRIGLAMDRSGRKPGQ